MGLIDNSIAVIAIDKETGKRVGEYKSISQAARKLYIRNASNIGNSLFGYSCKTMNFKGIPKGISSYKTGKKYLFEVKQK
jgi:hypothetical protein